MKYIPLIICMIIVQFSFAQTDTLEFDDPLVDSLKNRIEYVRCTMDYPDSLDITDSMRVIIVSFLMHPDGSFSNLAIERGEDKLVCQFALDFFKKTIRLQAFDILGEKYYIWYAVPVIVSLI